MPLIGKRENVSDYKTVCQNLPHKYHFFNIIILDAIIK